MITMLENLCREFLGISFARVLAGFVGVIALWLAIEGIKDSQTTKKLIAKKELEGSTKLSENNQDCYKLIIDDSYLPTNSSPYMKKTGVSKYV